MFITIDYMLLQSLHVYYNRLHVITVTPCLLQYFNFMLLQSLHVYYNRLHVITVTPCLLQ